MKIYRNSSEKKLRKKRKRERASERERARERERDIFLRKYFVETGSPPQNKSSFSDVTAYVIGQPTQLHKQDNRKEIKNTLQGKEKA